MFMIGMIRWLNILKAFRFFVLLRSFCLSQVLGFPRFMKQKDKAEATKEGGINKKKKKKKTEGGSMGASGKRQILPLLTRVLIVFAII